MTLPVWPSQLVSTARDGWQMPQMFVQPIASEMDGGNQRLRSRPGSNVAIITYPLQPMTVSDYNTYFVPFIRDDLGNGASKWTMDVTIAGTDVTKTVQFDGGKSPSVSQEGMLMNVTLPLRVFGV